MRKRVTRTFQHAILYVRNRIDGEVPARKQTVRQRLSLGTNKDFHYIFFIGMYLQIVQVLHCPKSAALDFLQVTVGHASENRKLFSRY